MPAAPRPSTIIVTGDLTADWHIALARRGDGRGTSAWTAEDAVSVYGCPGGAALLADLVRALVARRGPRGGKRWRVASPPFETDGLTPRTPGLTHSFATWGVFTKVGAVTEADKEPRWRVRDFLGLDRLSAADGAPPAWKRVKADEPRPDILVLDDANLGFRDTDALWPAALGKGGRPGHIVLKMAGPTAQGPLWDRLIGRFAARLTVIVPISDLRQEAVTISQGLSWEVTATDLVRELATNPAISGLAAAANLIVSFGPDGALIRRSNRGGEPSYQLIFDPSHIEGEWARALPGGMVGYTTCMAGAVIDRVDPARADWLDGAVESGVAAMRAAHTHGYGPAGADATPGEANLRFPMAAVVETLANPAPALGRTSVPNWGEQRLGRAASWSILRDRIGGRVSAVAEEIVLNGPKAVLAKVPLARFGALITVDRQEIVALRSLSTVIREYWDQARPEPLSVAVFGAPGSGKSFAVKQLAAAIFGRDKVTTLTFNLSQLAGPDALVSALHQVRDLALGVRVPLVFWDEFDTSLPGRELGWLRYFLAPMQDGTFQDGQVTHPIGRAIFVFAGGRASSVDEFSGLLENEARRTEAKLPDFVSRLKGHLTVLGPNPTPGVVDSFYPIRRALLLRSLLERLVPKLKRPGKSDVLEIDRGVLRALLRIPAYAHGARSVEAIIAMSQLAGKTRFTRSSVPSAGQLALHLDAREFVRLMQEPQLSEDQVDELAPVIHRAFVADMRAKGYRYGTVTNDRRKTHSSLVAFEKLPASEQEQNRDSARSIPAKLAEAGFTVVPDSLGRGARLSKTVIDRLARLEHERWVRMKIEQGWRHGARTDKPRRIHQALLPWPKPRTRQEWSERYGPGGYEAMGRTELPEREKVKDRRIVRQIPALLKKAGLVVVPG